MMGVPIPPLNYPSNSPQTALLKGLYKRAVDPLLTLIFNDFLIKNNGKSIYRDLGTICIFLIRKNHEDSTSQHVCRWSVAQF